MASYGVLTALSGFSYSAPERRMGFEPRLFDDDFKAFFSVGSGWGVYSQKVQKKSAKLGVRVDYGSLTVQTLTTPLAKKNRTATVKLGKQTLAAKVANKAIVLDAPATIEAGQKLEIVLN